LSTIRLVQGGIMSIHLVKLIDKKEVAEGTMAFIFEKPVGFNFKDGQFGDFTLLNPAETDAEGIIRAFSLTEPPYAKDLASQSCGFNRHEPNF